MRLYITTKTTAEDLVFNFITLQLKSGQTVEITYDESDYGNNDGLRNSRHKGVYFDEEYANGRILELIDMKVINAQIYSDKYEQADFEILQMTFDDEGMELTFENVYKAEGANANG